MLPCEAAGNNENEEIDPQARAKDLPPLAVPPNVSHW